MKLLISAQRFLELHSHHWEVKAITRLYVALFFLTQTFDLIIRTFLFRKRALPCTSPSASSRTRNRKIGNDGFRVTTAIVDASSVRTFSALPRDRRAIPPNEPTL